MVFPLASQRGASLVELMIAALVGAIALSTIGSVFISGQKLASGQGKQLLLEQNLASVMLQLKEDIQRAGFNAGELSGVKLSGADSTLYIENSPGLIGYVYRIALSGEDAFLNVVVKREPATQAMTGDGLKICEKRSAQPLTVNVAQQSGYLGYCYHLFNPAQISIREFSILSDDVASTQSRRQMIAVVIKGELVGDNRVSYQAKIRALLRNGV